MTFDIVSIEEQSTTPACAPCSAIQMTARPPVRCQADMLNDVERADPLQRRLDLRKMDQAACSPRYSAPGIQNSVCSPQQVVQMFSQSHRLLQVYPVMIQDALSPRFLFVSALFCFLFSSGPAHLMTTGHFRPPLVVERACFARGSHGSCFCLYLFLSPCFLAWFLFWGISKGVLGLFGR